MLWHNNRKIAAGTVDIFGGGMLFNTVQPYLEKEGFSIGAIYDDQGSRGHAWGAGTQAARDPERPILFCVGYQPDAPLRMARRWKRYRELKADGVSFATFLSDDAFVGPGCTIGNGGIIMPGVFLHCRVTIGECVYVNVGALLSHDDRIADNVFIGPRATVAGGVTVESGAFIGVGATVIDSQNIGADSLVAGGAVVTGPVPPETLVAGVPAVRKKSLAAPGGEKA